MGKIDTSEWKEFRVGDLFDIHPTKAYKCTNAELLDGGGTNVVVNSAYDNGIGGTSTFSPTENGNMITFSDTVDANTIFYQESPFVGYPHVQGLYPVGKYQNAWTRGSLQYFVTVFRERALAVGFDYGNKFRRDIAANLFVRLPATPDGAPDWAYMESYMANLETKVAESLTMLQAAKDVEKKKVDTREWKPFAIGELFDVVKGKRLTKAEMKPGNIRFIGSSASNNGCTAMIGNDKNQHSGNTITVCYNGSVGETFYQNQPFVASDDVNVLCPKFAMNQQIALFIAPLIKSASSRYDYIDKWKKETMEADKILLPVDQNGDPDWFYMEEYMKMVQEKTEDTLNQFVLA